jgi:ribosomal protein S18 acetylase RimI-like enzyme
MSNSSTQSHCPLTTGKQRWIQRSASKADLPELLRLEAMSFSGDRVSRRSFARWLGKSNNATMVLAHPDQPDRLLGYGLVLFHAHGRVARIYSLAVDPDWRGMGLGRRLLSTCLDQARQRGYTEVRLEVSADNHSALTLYLNAGFQIFGRRPGYYQNGSDAIRLRITI